MTKLSELQTWHKTLCNFHLLLLLSTTAEFSLFRASEPIFFVQQHLVVFRHFCLHLFSIMVLDLHFLFVLLPAFFFHSCLHILWDQSFPLRILCSHLLSQWPSTFVSNPFSFIFSTVPPSILARFISYTPIFAQVFSLV